jgi:predicted aldo/keto reductase-like oxidoreductase
MVDRRKFENLNVEASLLGFGCMRFPKHRDESINEEKSFAMIDEAYKNGVNYFDTAYGYHEGKSEEFVGRALAKYDRSTFFVATKLPVWLVNSVEDAKRLFEEQLTRLNMEYVDFYLLHALNKERFDQMVSLGILEFCDQLKAEGTIRHFGFSFHDDFDAFSYIFNYRKWDFCQIQFNYMDTEEQAGRKGYDLAESLGIPLVIMEPVKGGSLIKLPTSALKHFTNIAPKKGTASWALRWVATLPNVKVVLSGMSSESQLKENLETFTSFQPLNEKEQEAVTNVMLTLKSRVKNGCTACSYCMPCPSGVDIPKNFKLWNNFGIFRNTGEVKWVWNNDIKEEEKAKNCVLCGKCEEMCPQKINIREDLKQAQIDLDKASMSK